MQSFIVSYEAATLLKTPATVKVSIAYPISTEVQLVPRASFSASGTVSNPKCVVLSWFEGCAGDSARRAELQRHRCGRAGRHCDFEALSNGRRADLDAIENLEKDGKSAGSRG